MRRATKTFTLGCSVLLFTAVVCGQEPVHDGTYWLQLSEDEQESFADGFLDCAGFYRLRQFCPKGGIRPKLLADLTFAFYYWDERFRSRPVRETFASYAEAICCPTLAEDEDGEVYEGPHGFYVGEFWRAGLYGLKGKTAFVAGYLDCYQNVVEGELEFPRSAEEYAKELNRWYGFEEPDSIREGTEEVPIADVLMKFGKPKGGGSQGQMGPRR